MVMFRTGEPGRIIKWGTPPNSDKDGVQQNNLEGKMTAPFQIQFLKDTGALMDDIGGHDPISPCTSHCLLSDESETTPISTWTSHCLLLGESETTSLLWVPSSMSVTNRTAQYHHLQVICHNTLYGCLFQIIQPPLYCISQTIYQLLYCFTNEP